ncbi:MAG: hypothetical protein H0V47_12155 [Chloroflexia bacterium]|nr:hypothetical protein [Chloroflexia bacterium]
MNYGGVNQGDTSMTPEEYIEELKRLSIAREPERLLEFAVEHGQSLQDSMTCEQRQQVSTLAERAVLLAHLNEAARQKV